MQNISSTIEQIKTTRTYLLELIKDLSIDQLNKVPTGFNNNIIWNIAHLTAAQQGLCYFRSGLDFPVDIQYIKPYSVGTKPETFVTTATFATIKELMFSSLDQLLADYNERIFKTYTPVTTRYNVEISNIDEAINFLPFHEGLHQGYILALKRLV